MCFIFLVEGAVAQTLYCPYCNPCLIPGMSSCWRKRGKKLEAAASILVSAATKETWLTEILGGVT